MKALNFPGLSAPAGICRSGLLALALVMPSGVAAQNAEKTDRVGDNVLDAAAQPLEDLNLRSDDIPTILIIAQAAPYELAAVTGQKDADDCQLIRQEIGLLEQALGPDVDQIAEKEGLADKGLRVGGNLLGGLIPFRGVVRELSGANAERAKFAAAISAGIARRGFLKGYGQGIGCAWVNEVSVQPSE